MLAYFNMSKSTYFYNQILLFKADKDKKLKEKIKSIYYKNKGRYGYRRINLALKNEGITVNHKKVQRIMSELHLYGVQPHAKYNSYHGEEGKIYKNLLLNKIIDKEKCKTYYERNFHTTNVNQIWSTDVSEFHIAAGKLYLSPIIDVHNREIVSYCISKSPNMNMINTMLDMAFEKYKNLDNLILHSDQGWQYQQKSYQLKLKNKNIRQSMSRKGNCYDNCVMEIFFGTMKNEMFYGHEYDFQTLDELKQAMSEYIDYYNNNRITVKLKGLTPILFRHQSNSQLICN